MPETITKAIRDIHEGLRRAQRRMRGARGGRQGAGGAGRDDGPAGGADEGGGPQPEFERAPPCATRSCSCAGCGRSWPPPPARSRPMCTRPPPSRGVQRRRAASPRAARGLLDRRAPERDSGRHAAPSAAPPASVTDGHRKAGSSLMAGTMPHAIFMEPDVDGPGTYAAYAAEFPCSTSDSDEAAAAQMPGRVAARSAPGSASGARPPDRDRRQLVRGRAFPGPAR